MSSTASSAPVERAARPRRTQEQRRNETQAKVLEAAIECLLEYGYSGTTTPRVAAKAGVTRGAQVHHFPSREDLVTAAVRYLAVRRAEEALAEFARIPQGGNVVEAALDLLWRLHQGPLFTATAELWLAARTDRALAEQLESVEPVVTSGLAAALAPLAPAGASTTVLRDFVYTAMDAMRGLLLSSYVWRDEARVRRQWARVRAQLLRLAAVELADYLPS
ncbi:TetR/AcrR family transcriptional regulator [Nocardia sp. NPDC004722]